MRFNKKRLLILCAAILLNGAEAQAKVTKAVLNVAPADYRGGCPAVLVAARPSVAPLAPRGQERARRRGDQNAP